MDIQTESININLHNYDIIVINSSAGKDSLVSIFEICRMADEQQYPKSKIVVSHQDLKNSEWKGTFELAKQQAELFGLAFYHIRRIDKNKKEESLLEYIERRGMFPSNKQRFCTSDFKRGPGMKIVTMLTKEMDQCSVLYVFGFRADESPARKKKEILKINKNLTTKKRAVHEYLPIHSMSTDHVWKIIKENNLPYHFAYDLGMPRLSCVFCVFSPFDALVIAGKANPELLDEYIKVEKKIGHTFREGFSIAEIKTAIDNNYQTKKIHDWIM